MFVDGCWLSVGHRSLFDLLRLLVIVLCSLFVVCWAMLLLFVVCLLFVGCWLVGCCFLFLVIFAFVR